MDTRRPSFTVHLRDGVVKEATLFELFAAIPQGTLLDLPRLQPHQRPPVATALAAMMTALRRYAPSPPSDQETWETEWMRQVGADALRLFAPAHEVAFFQPPLTNANAPSVGLSEVDYTMVRQAHEQKPTRTSHAEAWVYALMAGGWAISVAKWHGGARQGYAVVLPSNDGTLGSEVWHLVQAYEHLQPRVVGSAVTPTRAGDHILWLRAHDTTVPIDEAPYPFIEARPVHLVEGRPISAVGQHSCPVRVQKGVWVEDPHCPTSNGAAYKVVKGRRFDARFEHAALFGSGQVRRPRILDLTTWRVVRLCAIGTAGLGKTKGYWQAVHVVGGAPRGFSLAPPSAEDRAADLSQRALGVMNQAAKALRAALARLHTPSSGDDAIWGYINTQSQRLRDALTAPTVDAVLGLLARSPDLTAEQAQLVAVTVPVLVDVYRACETAIPEPLRRARAESRLHWDIADMTGGKSMITPPLTPLAKRTYAVLQDVVRHLTPDDRATLRSTRGGEAPLAYWLLLARVPTEQAENPATEAVWRAVLTALGQVKLGNRGVGYLLAETEYPEARMSRLLTATGEALIAQLAEAMRWLVAHEVDACDLSQITTLGLADALGDREAMDQMRRRLALDYSRSHKTEVV